MRHTWDPLACSKVVWLVAHRIVASDKVKVQDVWACEVLHEICGDTAPIGHTAQSLLLPFELIEAL